MPCGCYMFQCLTTDCSFMYKSSLSSLPARRKFGVPWRVYACSAIRAATAVRTAQVNDETALELCRHAHRHPRAEHDTSVDRELHENLRILSESILNDLQVIDNFNLSNQ